MPSRFAMRWSTDSLEALEPHELALLEVLNDCIGPGSTVSFTLGTVTEMAERLPYFAGHDGRVRYALSVLVRRGYLIFAPTIHGGVQLSVGGCRRLDAGVALSTLAVLDRALINDREAHQLRLGRERA